ncbi:MAG: hypothetical protein II000_08070 [Clostridia bacterium]|nr:hypothetical protein [Clostridia bacterium]
MKRTGKILSLLLIAVMLLTMLPVAAFADPPVGDTHRHNWVVTSYKKATCTENGKRTWKCTLCGQTYSETYKALGHKWDEGTVTTEPHGFTPGVRTFTCKNDPSHTYTEEIGALEYLFPWLNGESFSSMTPYGPAPLVITEQPQGGSITRYEGETHTMHVTASGGAGGYTYEWFSGTQENGKKEGANDFLKWLGGLFGVSAEEVDKLLNTPLSKTDTLTTETANDSYYCVVKDKAGTEVTSEKARVSYKIRIAKQPDNVNLQIENPTLFCEAVDGSLDYTYRWFDHDEGFLGEGQSYPIDKEGYYYCVVTDNVTGETVQSEYSDVYSTPPFRLVQITPDFSIAPNQQKTITASFADGLDPYEIWWKKDGVAVDSVEEPIDGHPGSHLQTSGPGEYTVYAVDSHYETIQATCVVTEEKLTVVQQPVGGELPLNQYVEISAEFSGGEAPYTYYLYCNGKAQQVSHVAPSFKVWYPCTCSILAVDAKKRSVMTNTVTVSEATFRIKEQTESTSIYVPYGKARIHVTPENGITPYTYEWSYGEWSYKEGRYIWYKLDGTESYYDADRIGRYRCLVRDAEKNYVWSKDIPVNYAGSAPMIVTQPKSRILVKDEDGYYIDSEFRCNAITANPDDQLSYQWYWRPWESDGSWHLVFKTISSYYDLDKPGMYQCKVVNLENDEYTWSEIVTAIEKLECTSARPARHSGDADWVYQFSFTGGAGPYEIYICHTFGDDAMPYASNVVRQTEVFFEKNMKLLTFTLPKYAEFWHYDTQSFGVEAAQYYLFVRDAVGQECKTPLVTWY